MQTVSQQLSQRATSNGVSLFYFIFLSKTHKQSLEKRARESTHRGLMVVLGRAASKGGRPPMRCSEGANRNAAQASLVWTCHNLLSRISFLPAAAAAESFVVKTPTAPSAARLIFIAFHHRQKSQFASATQDPSLSLSDLTFYGGFYSQ